VGAFSLKFSIALAAKLLVGSKKVRGAKTGQTSSITVSSTVGIVGRAPAVDEKVWCFFLSVCQTVCLSRFGITKFVITETLWSSVIFITITVPLHRGRFLVVHLYSSFSINPRDFFLGANLYQKLQFLAILAAITHKATFLPRDAMHKRGLCCHAASVPLSVCPSVTFVDHVKTNKRIFEIFSPSGSDTILVFPYQRGCRYSDGNPLTGASNARGMIKWRFFHKYLALSQKRL